MGFIISCEQFQEQFMKYFGQQVFQSKSQSLGCQMKAGVTELCNGLAVTVSSRTTIPFIYSRDPRQSK